MSDNNSIQSLPDQDTDGGSAQSASRTFVVCGIKFTVPRKYKLIKPIGHGAYGVVCSAQNMETEEHVAIKKITKTFANVIESKRTLREIKLLRHFNHENIISLRDLLRPESKDQFEDIYLVTELLDTDLHQIITSPQPLTNEHIQYFVYQILRGLKYIHSASVLHRDLKPSNLLLNGNCDLKICDFGLARGVNPDESHQGFMTEYVATRWYRAPEIMLSWKEYSNKIDVWSVGCIMAELLGRKPLFPGRDYMHQLHLIIDILGTPSMEDTEYIASEKAKRYIRSLESRPRVPLQSLYPNASPDALDFLDRLLQFAPEKRMTVEQALAHPYLALLHDPNDEPVCDSNFDFSFETDSMTKESLKEMLWDELENFSPPVIRKLNSIDDATME